MASQRSRSRERREREGTAAPPSASAGDNVSRSELDAILESVESRINGSIEAVEGRINESIKVSASEVKATFSSRLRQYDESVQRRFSHVESDVTAVQKRLEASEKDNEKLWDAVGHLQRSMAIAETAVPHKEDFSDESFNRKVDATILRISSKAILAKSAVQSCIASWLGEADLDTSQYELQGLDSSKKFVLQFKANAGTAKSRASKAFGLLRGSDGKWKDFSVSKPSGGEERLFISRDKNGAQVKRELDTRRLAGAWRAVCTDRPDFHVNKSEASFLSIGCPLFVLIPRQVTTLPTYDGTRNGSAKTRSITKLSRRSTRVCLARGKKFPGRVFSRLLTPWSKSKSSSIGLSSWNARALLHHKPRLRDAKRNLVDDVSMNSSILAFQELHGSKEKLELTYPRLHQKFHVFTSFTERLDAKGQPKQDEAGVALALAKCGTSSAECFSQRVFAPGRVLRVAAAAGDNESIYWNVHNYGLSAIQLNAIETAMGADVARAAANPRQVTVFVLGDFNYLCEGEYQRSLELPNDSRIGSHFLPAPRAWQAKWQSILKDLTELAQPWTHISAMRMASAPGLTASIRRSPRGFCSRSA